MEKGSKRVKNAWAFYDWANSVYSLIITSAVFPLYYASATSKKELANHTERMVDGETVHYITFFGVEFVNTAITSYLYSFSFLVVAAMIPLLTGIADYSGKKRLFLRIFAYIGSLSCIALYFFDANQLELSLIPLFTASIGFWGSMVFYNSYLPEIASLDEQDKLSAKGYTLGYLGSVLLMILCMVLCMPFGFNQEWNLAFLLVGVWWLVGTQIVLSFLPENSAGQQPVPGKSMVLMGFVELQKVFRQLQKLKRLKRYQAAFFVYSMGVQTVMLMATFFGAKAINWPIDPETGEQDDSGLVVAILIIQLVAGIGAYFMAWLAKRMGNINVLKITVGLWALICLMAYVIHEPIEFYVLAGFVGFVMGGIQSMSRSTYSKFLPETKDHASFFSYFDVLEKLGIVIGAFLYGFIEDLTGSMRNSALVLTVFFVVGFILLTFVPKNETKVDDSIVEA